MHFHITMNKFFYLFCVLRFKKSSRWSNFRKMTSYWSGKQFFRSWQDSNKTNLDYQNKIITFYWLLAPQQSVIISTSFIVLPTECIGIKTAWYSQPRAFISETYLRVPTHCTCKSLLILHISTVTSWTLSIKAKDNLITWHRLPLSQIQKTLINYQRWPIFSTLSNNFKKQNWQMHIMVASFLGQFLENQK